MHSIYDHVREALATLIFKRWIRASSKYKMVYLLVYYAHGAKLSGYS